MDRVSSDYQNFMSEIYSRFYKEESKVIDNKNLNNSNNNFHKKKEEAIKPIVSYHNIVKEDSPKKIIEDSKNEVFNKKEATINN
ncbi:hypothetical protein ACI3PL_22515, partial [Lacticaseibacillus paracasei]